MTLQQIRDKFVMKYKLAAQVNNVNYIDLDNPFIIELINEAEGDIQTANLVNRTTYDITTNDDDPQQYTLPADFQLIDEWDMANREDCVVYTIFRNDDGEAIIEFSGKPDDTSYTIKYFPEYYKKHSALTEDSNLPDKYENAIIYYMLSNIVPSYMGAYENELRTQKYRSTTTKPRKILYSLGGVNNATSGR